MAFVKKLVMGIKQRIDDHNLSLVAAGVAFFAFLSVFPAIAVCISIFGLLVDPQMVQDNMSQLSSYLPPEVLNLIESRMKDIAENQDGSMTFALVFGVLVSLWSANKAMKAVAQGLNISFELDEDRGFFLKNIVTLALTLLSSVCVIVVMGATIALPMVTSILLSESSSDWFVRIFTWVLMLSTLLALSLVLYRYAPARDYKPNIKASIPGALFTAIAILAGSVGFSLYVDNFGKFEEEYGAIAGVVVTLLWLYLSAFIFLLGAEFNGERREINDEDKGP